MELKFKSQVREINGVKYLRIPVEAYDFDKVEVNKSYRVKLVLGDD